MSITKIYWSIHNHCKAECSYCPSRIWGGEISKGIEDYMMVLEKIVNHFNNMNRVIDWTFDGGEPLELHDFPQMLKYCKEHSGTINLNTNGGRLWLDWWAIEPHVDNLTLTYHYWQKHNLIDYIIEIFQEKSKNITVKVPIRPNFFDFDIDRSRQIELRHGIKVQKDLLFHNASVVGGLLPYTAEQISLITESPIPSDPQPEPTFAEAVQTKADSSPIYIGKLCFTGIERLKISHDGWVSGSNCNNTPLGNIWDNTFLLPVNPTMCKMLACMDPDDQTITKLD